MVSAVFAGWLGPYDPQLESRHESFHPPSQVHFWDEDGNFHLTPFVYRTELEVDEYYRRNYKEDTSLRFPLRVARGRLLSVEDPAHLYLLGTDSRGRDLFSRILFGARVSLSVGFLGVFLSTVLGLVIGAASGYFGGRIDQILMRTAELFIMIPGFYFLLALRGVLPAELGSKQIYMLIVVILSFIGWGGIARVVRGMVLSIRESEFVMAARVLGRRHGEILLRHVIPHTFSYLLIVVSVSIPSYILAESVLSVLGLGIQEPDISWGNLLSEALSVAHIQLHPWVLFPGVVIFLTALSFNALGDGLRSERNS